MNTTVTVADVKAALEPQFGTTSTLQILNEVCERYTKSGKWKGATLEVDFPSADGFITLPYEFESVLAMTYDRAPGLTYTQFHTYTINGPGELLDTRTWPGILVDMGDGFATRFNIDTVGALKITTDAADNGKLIRIFGLDSSGEVIYTNGIPGEQVTCAAPFVTTTQSFASVTGIQSCPDPAIVMSKFWSLYDAGDKLLSTYYPGENRPCYRRYQTGQAEKAIRLICQRRFIRARNDSDWVYPDSIPALRYGFWAWKFEDGSDIQKAEEAWNYGLNLLNQEAKYSRGGGIPSTAFINWGVMGGCYGQGWGQPGLVTL